MVRFEQRMNTLKGFKNFGLKAKARIWPLRSCTCHIRSTPVGCLRWRVKGCRPSTNAFSKPRETRSVCRNRKVPVSLSRGARPNQLLLISRWGCKKRCLPSVGRRQPVVVEIAQARLSLCLSLSLSLSISLSASLPLSLYLPVPLTLSLPLPLSPPLSFSLSHLPLSLSLTHTHRGEGTRQWW
jgi:CCR4-NOT transcription complex subunit 10